VALRWREGKGRFEIEMDGHRPSEEATGEDEDGGAARGRRTER
jgi:hypothetical protein